MPPRLLLALLAAALFSAAATAQDEHGRRLAAELVVMAGDVRRAASGSEVALHQQGLQERLAGALASLPLLIRHAGGDAAGVPALRAALVRGDWRSLSAGLNALQRQHPLDLATLLPAQATPERLRLGKAIHKQACAVCHDAPASETKLPAFNLFVQARRMPREEFAARLLLGVRGDRSTAWRNPFSDLELGALMAYYENDKAEGAARD